MTRLVRAAGWLMISLGALVVLYLVYSLWFTNLGTNRAQQRLQEDFLARIEQRSAEPAGGQARVERPTAPDDADSRAPTATSDVADPAPSEAVDDPVLDEVPGGGTGDAVALLWFERPGAEPPVTDERYVVVDGVSLTDLVAGPGHYPHTAAPGEEGNFAVAGHRTTHGAPFFRLDALRDGDLVHVLDVHGDEHVYRIVDERIVAPTATWVVGPDPLGLDAPTLTLTTCHPRFSNRQRLIAFGELVS